MSLPASSPYKWYTPDYTFHLGQYHTCNSQHLGQYHRCQQSTPGAISHMSTPGAISHMSTVNTWGNITRVNSQHLGQYRTCQQSTPGAISQVSTVNICSWTAVNTLLLSTSTLTCVHFRDCNFDLPFSFTVNTFMRKCKITDNMCLEQPGVQQIYSFYPKNVSQKSEALKKQESRTKGNSLQFITAT